MLPRFTLKKAHNCGCSHTVFSSKLPESKTANTFAILSPNRSHFAFRQFSRMAILSFGMSAFFATILNILVSSANKKMRRIGANRIIAFVADQFSFWNFPIGKNPRQSVDRPKFLFSHENSIAEFCATKFPTPAASFFDNMRPKSSNVFFAHN